MLDTNSAVSTSTIRYIDYLPGTGKTFWMATQLVKYLYLHIHSAKTNKEIDYDKVPQLIIVVAPTINLLLEMQKTILSEFAAYISKRHSDYDTVSDYMSQAYNSLYRLYGNTLVDCDESKYCNILNHTYTLEPSAFKNSFYEKNISQLLKDSSMVYNANVKKLLQMSEQSHSLQYAKKLKYEDTSSYEHTKFKNLTRQLSYTAGSIVFVTQAAFWNANHDPLSKDKTFWNKASTWLIIDEARSCNCNSISIALSEKTSECITKVFGNDIYEKYVEINNDFYTIPEIRDSIIEDSGYTTLTKLESYISRYKGSSLFIKISASSKDDSVKKIKRVILALVQVPYTAFSGWKKVTLMSAFFKDSQLYAVLSSANTGLLRSDISFKLEPEKNTKILENNEKLIKICCSRATITYVYDNDAYISKKMYNKGVVYSVGSSLVSTVNKNALLSFSICKNSKDSQQSFFANYNSLMSFVRENRVSKLPGKPESFEAKYFNKFQNSIVYMPPLEFAIRMSLLYSKAWLKSFGHITEREFIRHNVLINYNKYLGVFERKPVDDELDRLLRTYYTSITTDTRGINKYIRYPIISVLAAYNATPAVDAWFSQFTTGYDSTKDYAIGQCIQTMLRCKVRDKYNISPTLIILSTRGLAEDIAKRLGVHVVPPSKLIKTSKKFSIAFGDVSEKENKALGEKRKTQMLEYSNKASSAVKAKNNLEKVLSDEALYKKAYLKKYFEKSIEKKKSKSLSANICYLKKKISSETNADTKIILLSKKSELLKKQDELSKICKELKRKLENQFLKQYTSNKKALIKDVEEYIPKVKDDRAKLAKYYAKKAEKLAKYEEYEARGIRREDIVEIPWEE